VGEQVNHSEETLSISNHISIDMYEKMLDKLSSMFIAVDIVGNIHFINSCGVRKLGYFTDELAVKSLLDIVHINDKKMVRESLFRLAANPQETLQWEDSKQSKDGDILTFKNEASFITTDSGDAFILIHCIESDTREENTAEIDQLHHINQLILNSVSEGIYGLDIESNVIFWNLAAEKLTGYQHEEFESKSLYNLIHHSNAKGERVSAKDCPIFKSLHSGTSIHVQEDILWRKDGTSFPVEYITNPIMENENFVGTVIAFKDISEKKKTQELLHNSEKLKAVGQLAAGIAHEIRNPLTSLRGFLQLAQTNGNQKQEYYKIMKEELNRIEIILNELLLLAKPQAAVFEQKDIRTLLLNVITLLDTQAIMNNVQIISKFDSDDLIIECDANQIKQVFINLIKNAIESMKDGGEIFVKAARQDGRINVQVVDQGCGIPEETLGMIGQPFFSTKEKGTGLGLMVSYSIIENHQGKISVKSRLGEGTSFTVTLPAFLE
jgi:PAS domain S-box-containing protein